MVVLVALFGFLRFLMRLLPERFLVHFGRGRARFPLGLAGLDADDGVRLATLGGI